MKKILVSFSVAVALVFSLLAAGVMADSHTAKVRVVHASPDAPAVDVYGNGDLTLVRLEGVRKRSAHLL